MSNKRKKNEDAGGGGGGVSEKNPGNLWWAGNCKSRRKISCMNKYFFADINHLKCTKLTILKIKLYII